MDIETTGNNGAKGLCPRSAFDFRNWSVFWKGVGKSLTEAESIVCPFAFTYLNSAHVIIMSSQVQVYYSFNHTKINPPPVFHGDQDLIKTVLIYICS